MPQRGTMLYRIQARTTLSFDRMSGEHRLLIGLLENADESYWRGNRAEVERWMKGEIGDAGFSFAAVCDNLGLDPDNVRGTIEADKIEWKPDDATSREYSYRWRDKNRGRYLAYMREWRARRKAAKGKELRHEI